MRVELELPASVAAEAGLNPDNAPREILRMLALHLYEHGRMSLGKSCEMAQMSQWEFADLNRDLGIPIRYSKAELAGDLSKLASV